MADTKISAEPAVTSLDGTEAFAVAQSGGSKKALAGQMGVSFGTAFPGSPATSDRFFRTDLGIEFYNDGTRWLSTQLFTAGHWVLALTAGTTFYLQMPFTDTFDIYIDRFLVQSQLVTTGSNYFTYQLISASGTVTVTNLGTLVSTLGDTQNNIVVHTQSVGAVVDTTGNQKGVGVVITETGTANANVQFSISYRLVG